MTTAIGIVGSVGLGAIVPTLAKRFLAVKKNEPIRHLWFLLAGPQHSSQLQHSTNGSSRIVCPHKMHVLEDLRVVVTANYDYFFRLARYLSSDIGHLLRAKRCRGSEFISTDCETITLQGVNNVLSGFS